MIISHLVARSANNIIGSNNDLPWSLKDDLLHFKSYTLHKPILMGRKTFESIGKPLPNRTSIVVTSKVLEPMNGLLSSNSIEEGIQLAKNIFKEESASELKSYFKKIPVLHLFQLQNFQQNFLRTKYVEYVIQII